MNASSGRDAASVMGSSEHGEQIGITAPFEDISDRNDTFQKLNLTDETGGYNPDDIGEFPVSRTHFDRQSHTHHIKRTLSGCIKFFSIVEVSWLYL